MQRHGMIIRLRPETKAAYKKYHQSVWPEVLSKIAECNIRNYSIFLHDGLLFSYFEYTGEDFNADMKKMADHPKTQEWWSIMGPMQGPLPTRLKDEWWASMTEVFHFD
jgi:L-rhamnose mutarotase